MGKLLSAGFDVCVCALLEWWANSNRVWIETRRCHSSNANPIRQRTVIRIFITASRWDVEIQFFFLLLRLSRSHFMPFHSHFDETDNNNNTTTDRCAAERWAMKKHICTKIPNPTNNNGNGNEAHLVWICHLNWFINQVFSTRTQFFSCSLCFGWAGGGVSQRYYFLSPAIWRTYSFYSWKC